MPEKHIMPKLSGYNYSATVSVAVSVAASSVAASVVAASVVASSVVASSVVASTVVASTVVSSTVDSTATVLSSATVAVSTVVSVAAALPQATMDAVITTAAKTATKFFFIIISPPKSKPGILKLCRFFNTKVRIPPFFWFVNSFFLILKHFMNFIRFCSHFVHISIFSSFLRRFCICKYEKILYHIGCQGQKVKKADASLLAEGVLTS